VAGNDDYDDYDYYDVGCPIFFVSTFFASRREPPDTGGGRVFSLDASSGLLATARRHGAEFVCPLCAQQHVV
jgi:hypothetical protein